ncbi:hypothetical protein [Moorena bouillonii]|nr:hypothetical protein [Moorena bouillonii]
MRICDRLGDRKSYTLMLKLHEPAYGLDYQGCLLTVLLSNTYHQ